MSQKRNDPCQCNSGKKYKHCCMNVKPKMPATTKVLFIGISLMLLAGAVLIYINAQTVDFSTPTNAGRVWSPEHNHWH